MLCPRPHPLTPDPPDLLPPLTPLLFRASHPDRIQASDLHLNIAASSPIQTSAASDSADVRLLTSAAAAAVDNRPDSGVALGGGSNTKPASACSQRDAAAAAATAKALGAVPHISVMDNTLELGAPGAGASAQKHHAPPADGDVATRADSATATASESSGSRPTLRATGRLERSLTMVGAGGADDLSDAGSDGSIGSYLEDTDDGSRDPDTTEEVGRLVGWLVGWLVGGLVGWWVVG